MNYLSVIKEAMVVTNKNWQLILMQFIFMILSFVSLLTIVGIPLAIAFVIFGIDLTEILRQQDLISVFHIGADMLKNSLPIVLFVILGFVLYVASVIAMWIFAFAGTIGSLAKTIINGQKFSLRFFWTEAKRLFFPLFIFTNVIGFAFALLAMVMGILSEMARKVISIAETQEATLAVFLGIFFFLVLLSVGLFLLLMTLGMMFYGCGYMIFGRPRPFKAIRQIAQYLYKTTSAHILLGILVCFYLVVGSIVVTITSLLASIPAAGPVLVMPFQFISQAAHGYLGLVILSALFLHYYRTGYLPSLPESRVSPDTSPPSVAEQAPVPEEKA
jgi:hypothetical protein